MSFNKNIPQPTDRLSQSQQDLLNNNLQLNTSFGVNHFPFDDLTADNGKHNFVQLKNRAGGVIPPGLVSGDETIYSKVIAGSGEIFLTRDNSGVQIQLTGPGTPTIGGSGNNFGYTFLPGGILLQWGFITISSSPNPYLFVAPNIPFPNNCFNISLSLNANSSTSAANTASTIGTPLTTGFRWNFTGTTSYQFIYWTAIGN